MSRNIIICIKFDYQKTRYVLSHDELPEAPLPPPGQKLDIYTFRILDCPRGKEPDKIAELIVNEFLRLNTRPNHGPNPWLVAYNIPYRILVSKGIVSPAPNIPLEEVAQRSNRQIFTINRAIAKGKLACSRPPGTKGGPRERIVNAIDVEFYFATLKPNYRMGETDDTVIETIMSNYED